MSTLNTSAAQPITDVHAHVLLPSLQAEVESRDPDGAREAAALELSRNGAASLAVSGPMVGARIPRLTDVNVRLGSMDEQGVDRQWVSPSPSHFYPWAGEQLAVSAMAWFEFSCGPLDDDAIRLIEHVISGRIVAFNPAQAERAADLFNGAGRKRASRWDCMIAAAAIEGSARLATLNTADFSRFKSAGLDLAAV